MTEGIDNLGVDMNIIKMKNNTSGNTLSLEYYKSLLENIVDCVWVFDYKNLCYLYISPSIYNLRGFTVEEVMAESIEDCFTPQSMQKLLNSNQKRISRILAGDLSDDIINDISEYEHYCKDGSIKTLEVSTRISYNKETQGIEIFGVSRDITKRKHYERELIEMAREKNDLLDKLNPHLSENTTNPRIYFFHKFMVYGPNQSIPIKWRTSKTEELLAFLLHNTENKVSKEEIIEALWPDASYEKSTTYLHTTLYNLKKDLSAMGIEIQIKYSNSHYSYHLPPFYSDIMEFKTIISSTILPFDSVDDKSAASYERALALYKNDYLGSNGYLWSLTDSTTLKEQYEKAAQSLSRYYFLKHNYNASIKTLRKLLEHDNLNEMVHELLLIVYLQQKDYSSFINHYTNLEKLLLYELGTTPKNSIKELYSKYAVKALKKLEHQST